MSERREIRVNVPALTRVEGEGALNLHISDGRISALQLAIYEPPRYFEKFLEGREPTEVPDIVARICGICPVAYQMSAVQALEQIAGFTASEELGRLRRIMYCGEWIQSHALHIHLLAAPDFLGCSSVTELAKTHAAEVRRGLMLQSLGNELIALFGGRSVHPVGVKVGGFHRLPTTDERQALAQKIEAALAEAAALVHWCASLPMPDDEQDFVSVSLRHPRDYPITEGRLVSDHGLDIDIADFEQHFAEHQVPHSTALHALLGGQPYLVGPLARLNLNLDRLPDSTRALLDESGVHFPSRNMFHSLLARALEIHLALTEAARLLALPADEAPDTATSPLPAGSGFGCTEAPRGILWHRYDTDERGLIAKAVIVPPTSQNQARIEQDLRTSLEHLGLERDADTLRLHAETVIRNYDPCISCATHFLDLRLLHEGTPGTQQNTQKLILIGAGSAKGPDELGPTVIRRLQDMPELAELQARGRLRLIPSLQPLRDGLAVLSEADRVVIVDLAPDHQVSDDPLQPVRVNGDAQAIGWHTHTLSIGHLAELQALFTPGRPTVEVLPLADDRPAALANRVRDWLLTTLRTAPST